MSTSLQRRLREIAEEMVRDRVTPGVVFLITRGDPIVCCETIGTTKYQDQDTQAVSQDTIYDIASITKIITATATLLLLDCGQVALDDQLSRFFPEAVYGSKVSLRHLLTHTSGIAIQMSKLVTLKEPTLIHQAIMRAPIEGMSGQRVMFTNVNSYLLGKVIELVSGMPLDRFFYEQLFAPLGMKNTVFNPPSHLLSNVAPTEITEDRGLIHGKVHDESVYALGGIAGHAGLFSTISDLDIFCQLWINYGEYKGHRFFSKSWAEKSITHQVLESEPGTGFGWMLNRSWMGKLGPISFGHTAFTGPSIMITPHFSLAVTLLTNRTYPKRINLDRHAYQARMMDVLYEELSTD